jgi:hypothetical protein
MKAGEFYYYAHLLFSWQPVDLYLTVNAFQEITCNTSSPSNSFVLQTVATAGIGRPLDTVHISFLFLFFVKIFKFLLFIKHIRKRTTCDDSIFQGTVGDHF